MLQTVFKRYEKKYRLTKEQYGEVLNLLSYNAVPDEYGESNICSIYYDTQNKLLICRSLEKPIYKEKLRSEPTAYRRTAVPALLSLRKSTRALFIKEELKPTIKTRFYI